jgi:hypothetical protein
MERSEIRVGIDAARSFPDFAALHPGYVPVSLAEGITRHPNALKLAD